MPVAETLGVLAHHGGLVVERPELSVGIVRAVSRPTGLELELLARRPLDRRNASERQADIRAGRGAPPMAPRRLLPPFDEGIDLRVGWLDHDGHAHWEFGSWSSSSGDHFEGRNGPSLHTVLRFPPLFDHVSVVLAWPEIGFAETVVELSLPDRATVERNTVSIWDAPLDVRRPPSSLRHRIAAVPTEALAVEAGRIVAMPQVLSRRDDAAVVLTRLTSVGDALSMEILSVADGERARAVNAIADVAEQMRAHGPGASVAVVHDRDAAWVRPGGGSAYGGSRVFRSTIEFTLSRLDGDILALIVAWPAAGLPDVYVEIPLREH
ncbi:hypothetical protein [Dactylosporangium sp. NPDC048998]|uniref:hypothetical protein n=1 Tax=Dactylosporangium sp. NPDC048998 TaxID=3363976 RepID=UPI0037247C76